MRRVLSSTRARLKKKERRKRVCDGREGRRERGEEREREKGKGRETEWNVVTTNAYSWEYNMYMYTCL